MPPDPALTSSWFSLYETLATAGFGPLLFLLLVGSYFGVWVWGKAATAREDELKGQCVVFRTQMAEAQIKSDKREAQLQAKLDELFGLMVNAAGMVEKSAAVAAGIIERRREPRSTDAP